MKNMNIRADWAQAPKLSVVSTVLHKTSLTSKSIENVCDSQCVHFTNHPGKPHSLQTLQGNCLTVYAAISGSLSILVFKKAGKSLCRAERSGCLYDVLCSLTGIH